MEQQIADQQVAIINNSIEVFRSAPQVLKANQDRTKKALVVGNDILAQWNTCWKIEDEDERLAALEKVDSRSLKFILNCSTALTEEKQIRSAITQMMDNFKSMFTEAENVIDKAKAGTVPNSVQAQRNAYATELKTITDRKKKEAEDKANKAKEVITIKTEAEKRLFTKYNTLLHEKKTKLLDAFNKATLETFDDVKARLIGYNPVLIKTNIMDMQLGIFAQYHNLSEVEAFILQVKEEKLNEFAANYAAEMTLQRDDLIANLDSKLSELEEAKRLADQAEANRIKLEQEKNEKKRKELEKQQEALRLQQQEQAAEQKRREEEEEQRLQTTTAAAQQEAEQNIEIKAQGEATMVMFEKEADIASAQPEIKTKDSFEITVLHPVGYTQLFSLWFEQEGKNLPVDKIGNTKLDQMKSWCEKAANKDGTKIESKFLKYEVITKAVSRKETVKKSEE